LATQKRPKTRIVIHFCKRPRHEPAQSGFDKFPRAGIDRGMKWVCLTIAIVSEVFGTSALN
jgi:hypothetical protein